MAEKRIRRTRHAMRTEITEVCDADFRQTGLAKEWVEKFYITRAGKLVVRQIWYTY